MNQKCKKKIVASNSESAAKKAFKEFGLSGYVYIKSPNSTIEKIYKGTLDKHAYVHHKKDGTKVIKDPFIVKRVYFTSYNKKPKRSSSYTKKSRSKQTKRSRRSTTNKAKRSKRSKSR
jgi:hypothetical protein